ncbi:glutamate--tRNA ligase [Ignicoccus hospitalis]|uniref:Glutamate--tRNA ligase n=1 Tax=Ignicoccus hospitalis (strain KIN4/I / DSM 18386 / JCM 14125) TaxID=453591 RepID=SYE_IGNH4|nr:glutamate--tRNA ligase [Ignicoccus hospitalis]A8ABI5.1 RecName: Full=Glutamate--tRNA ligase; AltName: Full=Glutamyl-tRNA synthetase; Short=GluRS [Ignicoccus hospitalis KIN4/I]ABU82287.1 glutamyl-tRNA synthetase [Ignicoccus hospitalis KIN4/I]HIH90793.1 glutamate--tRNA ligase [Desulfurococcaceae archaeon]
MDVRELALKHALRNAYLHGGKAQLKPVVTAVLAESPELRPKVKEIIPIIKEVVEEVNRMSLEEQERILKERFPEALEERKKETRKGLPPLPNAERGKVKTRFAPNPDFYMTLGNARPAIISYEYAKAYEGRFVLRFEDTDPRTKRPLPEAYEAIKEDLSWLGIGWDEEYYQSQRMEVYYGLLRELVRRGGAYVCTCPPEEWRKLRDEGKPCPHRDLPPEEQEELLDQVLEGKFGEGEAVVRVKTDLRHPDPSVRDWVAFRIIDTSKHPHPLTGDKYVLWPTYNFAAGVDDYLMGITHVLRAREHRQNTVKQEFLYKHLGWTMPTVIHFGRLKLEGFVLSKSKMREAGFKGDDPRAATIRGLRRRGFAPEAIREVMLSVGIKSSDASISFANLAAENKKVIDKKAYRVMAVEDPAPAKLLAPEPLEAELPWHPTEGLGSRKYSVEPGEVVYLERADLRRAKRRGGLRLMELANFKYKGFDEDEGVYLLEFESKELDKEKGYDIVQWVKDPKGAIVWRPGERKSFALVEPEALKLEGWVQLIRKGYAKVDGVEEDTLNLIYLHE